MKTAIINIKVDAEEKKAAQALAKELGFSLSSVLKAYLKDFLRKQRVAVDLKEEELELSDWAKQELATADDDIKKGYVSPTFDSLEEEVAWLDDPNAKYANGRPVR